MGSGSSAAAGVKRIQVLAGAQRDLGEAAAFYRARDERIVARFVAVIDHHLELIAEHPERAPIATGTKGPTEYRRLKVQGFPFGICTAFAPMRWRSSPSPTNVAAPATVRAGESRGAHNNKTTTAEPMHRHGSGRVCRAQS